VPAAAKWPSPFSAGNYRVSEPLRPLFYVTDFMIKADEYINNSNRATIHHWTKACDGKPIKVVHENMFEDVS